MRLTKYSLAFFFYFGKIDIREPGSQNERRKHCLRFWCSVLQFYLYKSEKKGGVAMITIKDVKGIFNQLRKILAMLDKIYHAMGLDKEE